MTPIEQQPGSQDAPGAAQPAAHIFPISLRHDAKKSKWLKIPQTGGESWIDYKIQPEEIGRFENFGLIIPQQRLVIDVDTYKGVTTADIDAALGVELDWPGALIQRTPAGGEHYAFTIPRGIEVRQGSDMVGIVGFDTRSAGKGWIAIGKHYVDETISGLPGAILTDPLPELPQVAIDAINGPSAQRATTGTSEVEDGDIDDLMISLAAQPLEDLDLEQMRAYLNKLPEGDAANYDAWVKTGMACAHQTEGSKAGFELWFEWSKQYENCSKDECLSKWRSFRAGTNRLKPTRFDYVIGRAGGRAAATPEISSTLMEVAAQVADIEGYDALVGKVRGMTLTTFSADRRGMIAKTVYEAFGKEAGMARADIKRALMPSKKARSSSDTDEGNQDGLPDWAQGWSYITTRSEFYNFHQGYAIKSDAFNAQHGRKPEPLSLETPPSALALNTYLIPIAQDIMFWPGAADFFDHQGMTYANNYKPPVIDPCDELSEEQEAAIDRFLRHVDLTVSTPDEARILTDWLAHVITNRVERVGWAMLLQGAQGTGKSYFVRLLQALLGKYATCLEPTAIAGRFTGWAHGSVVVAVEEIRLAGTNKYEVVDRLKPFITNPTVQIEEKGRDHRTVPNFTSYFMLTNHKDAIPLIEGDRRYCVIFSKIQSEDALYERLGGEQAAADYFTTLFNDLEQHPEAFARFFKDYQISDDFKPSGRAPATSARTSMMEMAISPERSDIEDAISMHECDVINDQMVDITWLNELCRTSGGDIELPKTRTLGAILLEIGYVPISKRRVKVGDKLHYIWHKPGLNDHQIKTVIREFHKQ